MPASTRPARMGPRPLPAGCEHDAGAEDEDGDENEERLPPPEVVAGSIREQAAEEGTGLVERHNVGLEQGEIVRLVCAELELGREGGQSQRRAWNGVSS